MKVLVSGLAAFVAGVGGGLLRPRAASQAVPSSTRPCAGLVWLAVLVTWRPLDHRGAARRLRVHDAPGVLHGSCTLRRAGRWSRPLLFGSARSCSPESRRAPCTMTAIGPPARAPPSLTRGAPRRTWSRRRPSTPGPTWPRCRALSARRDARRRRGTAPDAPVLEARGMTVRFGGITALNDVSIEVPPATIVGLVGPNGAGKSTLFGVLSGLLRPQAGDVLLAGRRRDAAAPSTRARLGLARTFQQPELFLGLTVREHLVLGDRVRHAATAAVDRPRDRRVAPPPVRRRAPIESSTCSTCSGCGGREHARLRAPARHEPPRRGRASAGHRSVGRPARRAVLGARPAETDPLAARAAHRRRRGAGLAAARRARRPHGARPVEHGVRARLRRPIADGTPDEIRATPQCARPTWETPKPSTARDAATPSADRRRASGATHP